jgi:hypothetical protein
MATPLLIMVPFLFIAGRRVLLLRDPHAGAALPPELQRERVQHPDPGEGLLLVRIDADARDGLGFQIPIGILAACKLGITSAEKLRRNRRYAIVLIVVLAALLPTLDPISLLLESLPFYLLYELSIVLAARWGRPATT